jgi:hypothetical protein
MRAAAKAVKSLVCMALVDYFRRASLEDEILLIEIDSSNPDVERLYDNTDALTWHLCPFLV